MKTKNENNILEHKRAKTNKPIIEFNLDLQSCRLTYYRLAKCNRVNYSHNTYTNKLIHCLIKTTQATVQRLGTNGTNSLILAQI